MKKEVKVQFIRNDGKEFLADFTEWGIPSGGIEGIDFATWNLYSQPLAFGHGSVVTGKQYSERNLKFTLRNINTNYNEFNRDTFISFFNPLYTFRVYITYQGKTKWIEAEVNGVSAPAKNVYEHIEGAVGFFCENPFLKSVDDFARDISSLEPRWGFPFIATEDYAPLMSVYNFSKQVILDNDGDVEIYFRCVLSFDGDVTNPYISEGEHLFKLIGTFTEDDTIEIDFEKKTVKKNGVSIYDLISRDSNFLDIFIPVGGTIVSMDADIGDNLMHCTIYYNKYYGGM